MAATSNASVIGRPGIDLLEPVSRARRQADLLEELRVRAADQIVGREPDSR